MKKILLLLVSLCLLTVPLCAAAAEQRQEQPLDIEVTNVTQNRDTLIVHAIIANVGNATLDHFTDLQLNVYNNDDDSTGLRNEGKYSGEIALSALTLAPGQTIPATFALYDTKDMNVNTVIFKWAAHYQAADTPDFTTGIHVFIDGSELRTDAPPLMVKDTTLVPMRAVFEQLGADVAWDPQTQTVEVTKGDTKVTHVVGSSVLEVNGREVKLDVPSMTISGRTMVPLRAFTSSLDCSVQWGRTGEATTIAITSW
ncbi:copper amine oxidase N-terminal domain-containing protein [Brevibacillus sp. B_LB10_24]|uniref:copper amine oxidase N-terminal domain-containing protein n=1 Tax=Brevibacillus sp. B_LB10_24 TaxID=3380645 RepID=UPI0038BC7958